MQAKCVHEMAGQSDSYMVGEPMPMANIHSVFRRLLLVISVFRYFYEPGLDSSVALSTSNVFHIHRGLVVVIGS